MRRLLYLGLFSISLIILGCSNSQKLLSAGNYEKAYKISLKELKKGKAAAKDVEILNAALDKIYDEKIEPILESENGESLEDGVDAYDGYEGLIKKFKESVKYLSVPNNERYTSLLDRKETLGYELYEDFKKYGISEFEKSKADNDRQAGQIAYASFERAQKYNPTPEIEALLDESYRYAVTIIVVEIEAPFNASFDYEIERTFKRVENIESKFTRYFFKRNHKDADCIIEITFDPFDFSSDFRTLNRTFTDQVQVERIEINAEGERVSTFVNEEVSCVLSIERTVSQLEIAADIIVKPQSNQCNASRDTYRDYYEDIYEDYNVTGDRRALPPEYTTTQNRRRPRDSDLVDIMMRKFYAVFSREYLNER